MNFPQTRHTANSNLLSSYLGGNPGGAASPNADAYRKKVSIPETTILALMTRISIPTSDTDRFASITKPLSNILSTRS